MYRPQNQMTHPTFIDLTHSDGGILGPQPHLFSQLVLPEPTQPSRSGRLTARECLRADRIVFGEIDVPTLSDPFIQNAFPPDEEMLDVEHEVTMHEANVQDREANLFVPIQAQSAAAAGIFDNIVNHGNKIREALEGLENRSRIQNVSGEFPDQQMLSPQSDTSPMVISSSSEYGDSSDDEFVLHGDKDIVDLTNLPDEEKQVVVEMMVNGRPRRACAPKSFEGLVNSREGKLVRRALEISTVTLTKEERAQADKYRDELVDKAVAAHYALWENRFVDRFSYNCGRVNVGRARAALIDMGSLIGASPKVVKRRESGGLVKYVIMEPGKRLCSPMEQDIRAAADKLVDCAFKDRTQKRKKTEKKKKEEKRKTKTKTQTQMQMQRKAPRSEVMRTSRKERNNKRNPGKTMKKMRWREKMAEVAQGVRIDEDAVNHIVPIQEEIQSEDIKQEPGMKTEDTPIASLPRIQKAKIKEEAQPVDTLHTSTTRSYDQDNERERRIQAQEDAVSSQESRQTAWERKRQRKLEGKKIDSGNKGFALLSKMGWHEGQVLGARSNGISEPIVAEFRAGRKGLGTK